MRLFRFPYGPYARKVQILLDLAELKCIATFPIRTAAP